MAFFYLQETKELLIISRLASMSKLGYQIGLRRRLSQSKKRDQHLTLNNPQCLYPTDMGNIQVRYTWYATYP